MAELLIELLNADLPARMQKQASEAFAKLMLSKLEEFDIPFDEGGFHSTPRRLIFFVNGLPTQIEDTIEERRGPRADAPEKAIEGFLRGAGVTLDQCEKRETAKGEFYFAKIIKKGGETSSVLQRLIPEAIGAMQWPKSMRWGETSVRWARPLKNILAVFDGKVVPFAFELGGNADPLKANTKTVGHRFLKPDEIKVTDFQDYQRKLHSAFVMINRDERKKIILDEAQLIAKAKGLDLIDDNALVEEIVGLIEWPVVLNGSFDEAFLHVPQECLISTMKKDQKYMPMFDKDGKLANSFIVVSNMITDDKGKAIVAGNEKVLRARLSDAQFFYEQDLKTKLEARRPALAQIKFHDQLGNLEQRTARLEALADKIAYEMEDTSGQSKIAASLCKCDLLSGMVGEFPELQGIMGRYYALAEKYPNKVAFAIEEHYSPAGPDDSCPTDPVSVQLALADKIDVLSGFFAIDQKPTGSKDPFALRRAALGIIRLILENKLRINLKGLFDFGVSLFDGIIDTSNKDKIVSDLLDFIADRLKVALKDKGVRHDVIDSVFSVSFDGDLTSMIARVEAIQTFIETDDGANLLAGYKRASNIVEIEEKKAASSFEKEINDTLLSQVEEKTLADLLNSSTAKIRPALEKENYQAVMQEIAKLRQPIDAFFDKVTVNDNDDAIRENRLAMLSKIKGTLNQVADFSKISDK